jgi:hypothetical protein
MTDAVPAPPSTDPRPPAVVGGWTGLGVILWAAVLAVAAAAASTALLTAQPLLTLGRSRLEQDALEQRVPPDEVLAPLDAVSGIALDLAAPLLPWAVGGTALAVLLLVSGLYLVRGSEAGRRLTRWTLAAAVLAAAGAVVHLSRTLLPGFDAESEGLRTAVHELAVALGERLDRRVLDDLQDRSRLEWAIWGLATLVAVPSAGLWLAVGRRELQGWCGLEPVSAPST